MVVLDEDYVQERETGLFTNQHDPHSTRTSILLHVKIKRGNEPVSCVHLLYEHEAFQNWIVCLFDKFKMLS